MAVLCLAEKGGVAPLQDRLVPLRIRMRMKILQRWCLFPERDSLMFLKVHLIKSVFLKPTRNMSFYKVGVFTDILGWIWTTCTHLHFAFIFHRQLWPPSGSSTKREQRGSSAGLDDLFWNLLLVFYFVNTTFPQTAQIFRFQNSSTYRTIP